MKTLHKSLTTSSIRAIYHLAHPTGTKAPERGGSVGDTMKEGKKSIELWKSINQEINKIVSSEEESPQED